MEISYEWSIIRKIDYLNDKDYSVTVNWFKIGTDERGMQAFVSDLAYFDVKEIDEDYIPWQKLSEDKIIERVIHSLSEEDRIRINSEIENQLKAM